MYRSNSMEERRESHLCSPPMGRKTYHSLLIRPAEDCEEKQNKCILKPGWRRQNTKEVFGDPRASFAGLVNLGNTHFRRCQYLEALRAYHEAVDVANDVKCFRDKELENLSAVAHHNLGVIYCIKDDFKAGFEEFVKALVIGKYALKEKKQRQISREVDVICTVKTLIGSKLRHEGLTSAQNLCFDAILVLRNYSSLLDVKPLMEMILRSSIDLLHKIDTPKKCFYRSMST